MVKVWLIYLGLGILEDVLITLYYLAVSRRRAVVASALTFLITILAFVVLESAIVSKDFRLILAYAVGAALGTAMGVAIGAKNGK